MYTGGGDDEMRITSLTSDTTAKRPSITDNHSSTWVPPCARLVNVDGGDRGWPCRELYHGWFG